MNILVLMPAASRRGGAEELLNRFLRYATALGPEWTVLFLEDGPFRRHLDRHGVQTRVVEAGRLRKPVTVLRTIHSVSALAEKIGADLIFSWMPKAHVYGGWAARWAGCPAAWYQHGAPSLGWMDRLVTLQPADAVIACSRHVAEMQSSLWPDRPTHVVHPAVDLETFDPDALPSPGDVRRDLDLPADGPLIGMVGRLQRWKGMHTFVDALAAVRETHPQARGVIVGGRHPHEAQYADTLKRRVDDRGIGSSLSMVGHQSNVHRWMQAMDVVVHASDAEPFGMVVIEAMALGKPVIAGAAGGPAEIIDPGVNGLQAPYGDARTLARRLRMLLDDPVTARRIGAAGQHRAQAFSASDFARELTTVLRWIAR
ncbi:MAG: glycosyltransferase [Bacteroidetes bacterium]|jgi:glycosyltransferase involved in cell wall biosynthesis|nr:glycosyltransferase [Bacteroidota bacterium]